MAESKIPVGSTGKDLRTVEQTTAAGLVHTEAVFVADPVDVALRAGVTDAAPAANAAGLVVRVAGTQAVSLVSQSLVKKTVTASASGDTTLHTPAAGKKIRLYFFGYSVGLFVTNVLVGLKLEGYNAGAVFDQQYLIAAGQPYARNLEAGDRYLEGSADGRLIVNLGAAQTVYCNYEIEEI